MDHKGNDRIHLLDALRGFSLLGIGVVHFLEQYLGNMPPPDHANYTQHGALDPAIDALAMLLIRGKGFALFSFLFGVSFALQMQRAQHRHPGRDFRPRFAWRLTVLLAIGFSHSLLYRGDILSVYALLGFPLMFCYRVPDRWLGILALALMIGLPRVGMMFALPASTPEDREARMTAMEEQAARHWRAAKEGPAPEMVRQNVTDGIALKMEFQFGPFARGYQTFAYFLLGLWAGRRRIFAEPENYRALFRRVLKWCGIPTVAILLLALLFMLASQFLPRDGEAEAAAAQAMPDFHTWPMVIGLGIYDTWNCVMTLFYVAGFVWLFQKDRWRNRLLRLAPVGRMALSNYLVQSLLGGAVFFCYGLGLLGEVGNTVILPLALVLFAGQMWLSRFWLRRFYYGPIEWLWRALTWWGRPRFRKPMAAMD